MLIMLMINISSFAQAASSSMTTIIPGEDSYVDSAKPTTNYGSTVTMWIRGSAPTRRSLLRFNLATIPANARISSAVLKLFVSGDGSSVAGSVNTVNGAWAENSVTYANAPQVGVSIAALPDPAIPNSSVSVDLTSFVIGKTLVDFYITSANNDGVVYYAREKGSAKAPQLIITWTTDAVSTPTNTMPPSLTPTSSNPPISSLTPTAFYVPTTTSSVIPTFTSTFTPPTITTPTVSLTPLPNQVLVFPPAADTYIQSDLLTSIFGSSNQIIVDNSPVRNTLLKFTVSGVGMRPVLSAKLRIYCIDSSPFGGEFHRVADTTWSEGAVNWNNAPAADTGSFASLGKVTASTWYEINVTSLITGDGTFSFKALSTSTDGAYYSSKEGAAGFAPQLVITTSILTPTSTAIVADTSTSIVTATPTSDPATPTDTFVSTATSTYTPSVDPTSTDTLIPSNTPTDTPTSSPSAMPTFTPAFTPTNTSLPTDSPTPPPSGSDPSIMAAGDIICNTLTTNSSGCQQMAVSQIVVDQQPAAALILGDLCHTPSVNCFDNYFNPSWGRLFSIAHPTTGNHDYLVSGAVYYFDYWNGIGNSAGPAGNRSQGYYSFDIGAWHLIALNSQCGDAGGCSSGSPQYLWLQQDLQDHPNLCTLAYYHIPVFSSGGRAETNMRQIYTLLYNNNVDVVLDGHDHIYERFAPQDPNGLADPLRGIREFIAGTGGANHTSIAAIQPNSEVRNTDTFGALKLTLHPDGYDWQFMPIPGKTFTDAGTALCH